MYSKSLGHFSARFEKLVKLSGTHLTQCAYAFVTYIQASAQELYQQQMEKKGKKGEKRKNADVGQAGKVRALTLCFNLQILCLLETTVSCFYLNTMTHFPSFLPSNLTLLLLDNVKSVPKENFEWNELGVT